MPLYRFFNSELDAYFYTHSAEERDFYLKSPNYVPEGGGDDIAFYVEPALENIRSGRQPTSANTKNFCFQ